MLEKLQMQIKAAQHTPKMLQNQTVRIFNWSQEGLAFHIQPSTSPHKKRNILQISYRN